MITQRKKTLPLTMNIMKKKVMNIQKKVMNIQKKNIQKKSMKMMEIRSTMMIAIALQRMKSKLYHEDNF